MHHEFPSFHVADGAALFSFFTLYFSFTGRATVVAVVVVVVVVVASAQFLFLFAA